MLPIIVRGFAPEHDLRARIGNFDRQPNTTCVMLTGSSARGPFQILIWTAGGPEDPREANVWLCLGEAGKEIVPERDRVAKLDGESINSLLHAVTLMLGLARLPDDPSALPLALGSFAELAPIAESMEGKEDSPTQAQLAAAS